MMDLRLLMTTAKAILVGLNSGTKHSFFELVLMGRTLHPMRLPLRHGC